MSLTVALVIAYITGLVGLLIASSKERHPAVGFLFGGILGVLGIAILAYLPPKAAGATSSRY